MKKDQRSKKLTLKLDTLSRLDAGRLTAAQGGGTTTLATTVFSEGACETFSWWRSC